MYLILAEMSILSGALAIIHRPGCFHLHLALVPEPSIRCNGLGDVVASDISIVYRMHCPFLCSLHPYHHRSLGDGLSRMIFNIFDLGAVGHLLPHIPDP
ncbi:unnamed protein product [Somion occarium]|uniref:Secreted protein n=1 Tax=Somion occarium TaxID=3059160 RepID=A0ABP1DBU7_9APHY